MKERVCIFAVSVYFVSLCLYLAVHNMMWADEFLAWNLISDPSFTHMLQSWYKGADSGGLLFYLLARPLAVAIRSPAAIRCSTALCFAVSGVFSFFTLRRRFGVAASALGICALWLGSPLVLSLSVEVRFYGLLMLAFCGVIYVTDRLMQGGSSAWSMVIVALVLHAVLLSSHMLGFIYSAEIVFALLLAYRSRATLAYASGALLSWLLLLFFLPAVRAGSEKLNWIKAPRLIDYVRFFLHEPFGVHAVNLLLYILLALALFYYFRDVLRLRGALDFVGVLATLLLLTPSLFAITSHVYKPIVADRYLVPWTFGLAFFPASLLAKLLSRVSVGPKTLVLSSGVVLVLLLHANAVRLFWKRPPHSLEAIKRFPSTLPIAISDDDVFEQLEYYDSAHSDRYVLLMPHHFRDDAKRSILATLAVQGYGGNMQDVDAFTAKHPRFLYARFSHDHGGYGALIASNSRLRVIRVSTLMFGSEAVPVLEVEVQSGR